MKLSIIVLFTSIANVAAWYPGYCDSWGNGLRADILNTGMDSGSDESSTDACKTRCINAWGCKAAQYCASGWDNCGYTSPATGRRFNCFIYNNQNANQPQLTPRTPNVNGYFLLYKYNPDSCRSQGRWGRALYKDIPGTGMGGTYTNTLQGCKDRCVNDYRCQAAQYSRYTTFQGSNCFNYNTQWGLTAPDIAYTRAARLYKYYRNGRRLEEDNSTFEGFEEEEGNSTLGNSTFIAV